MKTIYILFFIVLVLIPIKSINKSEFISRDEHVNLIFSQLYIFTKNLDEKIVSK